MSDTNRVFLISKLTLTWIMYKGRTRRQILSSSTPRKSNIVIRVSTGSRQIGGSSPSASLINVNEVRRIGDITDGGGVRAGFIRLDIIASITWGNSAKTG